MESIIFWNIKQFTKYSSHITQKCFYLIYICRKVCTDNSTELLLILARKFEIKTEIYYCCGYYGVHRFTFKIILIKTLKTYLILLKINEFLFKTNEEGLKRQQIIYKEFK